MANQLPSFNTFLATGLVRADNAPSDATCCICCQPYNATDCSRVYSSEPDVTPDASTKEASEKPVRLPCNHVLGESCARTWFTDGEGGNDACPLCRVKVFAREQPLDGYNSDEEFDDDDDIEYDDDNDERPAWTFPEGFLSNISDVEVAEESDDLARHMQEDAAGLLQALLLMGPCLPPSTQNVEAELVVGEDDAVEFEGGFSCNAWGW
ncbi:hypothetical protein LTS18_009941 [Coniosporium uncinatum]|uniref:Uncharacterized protein n=1 Tax=Coniosporium uncinatum TaxID=93489 RepID=A0ACC3DM04_9PEZI|nr:hypothetical protein LTS18_009941 [Coniosporium uncinatum]